MCFSKRNGRNREGVTITINGNEVSSMHIKGEVQAMEEYIAGEKFQGERRSAMKG